MTIFSKNLRGMAPLAPPGYACKSHPTFHSRIASVQNDFAVVYVNKNFTQSQHTCRVFACSMRRSSMIERASVYAGSLFIPTSITAPQCTKIITLIIRMANPRTTGIFLLLTTSVANWQYEIFFIILCLCLHRTVNTLLDSSTANDEVFPVIAAALLPDYDNWTSDVTIRSK